MSADQTHVKMDEETNDEASASDILVDFDQFDDNDLKEIQEALKISMSSIRSINFKESVLLWQLNASWSV